MTEESTGTLRFPLLCGRMVYKQVRQEVRGLAFRLGLSFECETDMGWLDGYLYFTLTGKESALLTAKAAIEQWAVR